MRIYKYKIPVGGKVKMPVHAKVLHVGVQDREICLWAQVDQGSPEVDYCFKIFATGQDITSTDLLYTGTVRDGDFVWHIYQVPSVNYMWPKPQNID